MKPGVYRTPFIGETSHRVSPLADEWHYEVAENGVITVYDPLFYDAIDIGDGSTFRDPRSDVFMKLFIEHQGWHASTRHLCNPESLETKVGAGRLCRLAHMVGSGTICNREGGSFQEIVQAVLHDASNMLGSHVSENLLQGSGKEDLTEGWLPAYLRRSGFVAAMQEHGLLGDDGRLIGTNDFLDDVISKGVSEFVDGKRPNPYIDNYHYLLFEGQQWLYSKHRARELMASFVRMRSSEYGDILAATSLDAALELATTDVRCSTEHWNDAMNESIDTLFIPVRQFVVGSESGAADRFDAHPYDAFYTLEEDLYSAVDTFAMDPFVSLIAERTKELTAEQRIIHAEYAELGDYRGPVAGENAKLSFVTEKPRFRMRFTNSSVKLGIVAGRSRKTLDPFVYTSSGLQRASDLAPEQYEHYEKLKRHVGHYVLELPFAKAEIQELQHGKRLVDISWRRARQRPRLTDEQFSARIADATSRARELGKVA